MSLLHWTLYTNIVKIHLYYYLKFSRLSFKGNSIRLTSTEICLLIIAKENVNSSYVYELIFQNFLKYIFRTRSLYVYESIFQNLLKYYLSRIVFYILHQRRSGIAIFDRNIERRIRFNTIIINWQIHVSICRRGRCIMLLRNKWNCS